MKRIIGILVITVLMSVNFALATETNNTQLDSNQDGSKINLNPKNLPICDSQPYDNCFAVLGKYSGEFHNGKYNGLGKYLQQVYTSTSYFIGDFKDDKKNGHFSLYSSENHNKIFEGDFINGMQSEYGIYYYANGDISDSCFLNPFLLCENHWNRRSRDWWNKHNIANLPAKQGAITPKLDHKKYKNGDSYDGEYFNNKPNGQGTYTWRTGEKYVGEFKNGLRNGKGVLYQSNGTLIYSGIWVSPSWEKENALAKTLPPTS